MTISQAQTGNSPHFGLLQTEDRLELVFPGHKKPFYVDFLTGELGQRLKRVKQNREPIAKAVGLKGDGNLVILDGTAGWGRDSMLLACLGARVLALERSPLVAALLKNGLERAQTVYPEVDIRVEEKDTLDYLQEISHLTNPPDVIYLDPMFPERTDSALVKKPLQLLQALLGKPEDADELVKEALRVLDNRWVKRVVVKRPMQAEPLVRAPHHVIVGGVVRFDVYFSIASASKL